MKTYQTFHITGNNDPNSLLARDIKTSMAISRTIQSTLPAITGTNEPSPIPVIKEQQKQQEQQQQQTNIQMQSQQIERSQQAQQVQEQVKLQVKQVKQVKQLQKIDGQTQQIKQMKQIKQEEQIKNNQYETVAKRFTFTMGDKPLGKGSFGVVFCAQDSKWPNEPKAIKLEKIKPKHSPQLFHEYRTYCALNGKDARTNKVHSSKPAVRGNFLFVLFICFILFIFFIFFCCLPVCVLQNVHAGG